MSSKGSDGETNIVATSSPEHDPNLVDWDGEDDQENVRLMSNTRKWTYSLILTTASFQLTMLSAIWSTANDAVEESLNTVHEVAVLGVSLFVLGFGLGPFAFAPLSENYGRKPMYFVASVGYIAFQFMTAFGKNIETVIIGRFITALFGSIYLSNVPGSISDMFDKSEQAAPMNVYSLGPFVGPTMGPLVGGFLTYYCGWRWVFYASLIMSGVMAVLVNGLVPETYAPVLKAKKAARLRRELNNPDLYAPFDRQEKNLWTAIKLNCTRPLKLFLLEPMMTLLCFYTGFLIAIVYFFFICFPIVFKDVYNFTLWEVGLAFLGVCIGMCTATAAGPLWARLHARSVQRNNGVVEPEMRLPQMCAGAPIVPVGLFIFAWTLYESVHWIVPIIASAIFGLGCNWTFTGILSYTVEAYTRYAASAMAANVLLRGLVACAFPLFGAQLLYGLGYHWGISLIAFVSVALAPSAFLLHRFGKTLRSKSKFALSS